MNTVLFWSLGMSPQAIRTSSWEQPYIARRTKEAIKEALTPEKDTEAEAHPLAVLAYYTIAALFSVFFLWFLNRETLRNLSTAPLQAQQQSDESTEFQS